ncbi:FK506-binding protein 5-like isoform X2 [Uloborus diversus]|uniref:FK506-binding protein 5-like isoform X2 n=1 Tax=Uloborus diversus TaxID=327109 RepID=UPI00240A52F8|nr:FK506-binding protein 5-like isoform X2 [Uloborus diversus]
MSRSSYGGRAQPKDMYWFAHGGLESSADRGAAQKCSAHGETEEESDSNPPSLKSLPERRTVLEEHRAAQIVKDSTDGPSNSSFPLLERDDRLRASDKRIAVEERRKQLLEAEQEKNDAVLRKHLEREAALEARRNAQRSNISFAFGSSVPRNVDSLQGGDSDKVSRHSASSGLTQKGDDVMSRSMSSAMAPRGRRKNDLMPTVPYDRTDRTAPISKSSPSSSSRKRSVSMTRLDQLAQPRKHYLEATKANSTANGGTSAKDSVRSPTRPLSSASEQSSGSGRGVIRRVRSSPRKPRPVSIAGTVPESRKSDPVKKTSPKKSVVGEIKKAIQSTVKITLSKSNEKAKVPEKTKPASKPIEKVTSPPKSAGVSKPSKPSSKATTPGKSSSPKAAAAKKSATNKKKDDILVPAPPVEVTSNKNEDVEKSSNPPSSPPPDGATSESEKNNMKKIISEEEAKAALAEKRRLAREQAEREVELERQKQEELRLIEEERLRQEEEEQKRMEEEQLRLLEEHRRQEEEKLKKAIEDQERKEEEEKMRREEEQRLKAELEKKAQEEAEKQRIELEEKLRKEEEERAERKKRLEKIMSRTRGKPSGTSPSGSVSSSDQLDSGDNQQEGFSSGANSLDSNESNDARSESVSNDDTRAQTEVLSGRNSLEGNHTFEVVSETESLNSNDLMMPVSETASQDNSLVIIPDKDLEPPTMGDKADTIVEATSADECRSSSVNVSDVVLAAEHLVQEGNFEKHQVVEVKNSSGHNISGDNLLSDERIIHEEVLQENQVMLPSPNEVDDVEAMIDSKDLTAFMSENDSAQNTDLSYVQEKNMLNDGFTALNQNTFEEDSNLFEVDGSVAKTVSDGEDEKKEFAQSELNVVAHDITNLNTVQTELDTSPGHTLSENMLFDSLAAVGEDGKLSHLSISSDMKLPDPIYETSEEGSLSSERQHPDFNSYTFQENFNEIAQDSNIVADDVFADEQEVVRVSSEMSHVESYGFSDNLTEHRIPFPSEPFSSNEHATSSQIMNTIQQNDDDGTFLHQQDAWHSSEKSEEHIQSSQDVFRSSEENVPDGEQNSVVSENVINTLSQEMENNKENIEHAVIDGASILPNPFSSAEVYYNEYDMHPEKENFQFQSGFEHVDFGEILESNIVHNNTHTFSSTESNPFLQNSALPDVNQFPAQEDKAFDSVQQHVFSSNQQISELESEQCTDGPSMLPSKPDELSDLTFIKAEGGENCIGIISSVDHDHLVNDFPKTDLLNEQLKSNFQFSSITDSEDSSLDSNLSQVMTVETEDNKAVEDFNNVSGVQQLGVNGVSKEQPELITKLEYSYNGDSILKTNGNHFSAAEIFSNGHRVESPETISQETGHLPSYVPLDGKDISSVETKTNIFENVDAIAFGKVSPDPFMTKENSNQIPGNPFLLQEDQKKVLMTPDFFN